MQHIVANAIMTPEQNALFFWKEADGPRKCWRSSLGAGID